jgi:hypothetical protein
MGASGVTGVAGGTDDSLSADALDKKLRELTSVIPATHVTPELLKVGSINSHG